MGSEEEFNILGSKTVQCETYSSVDDMLGSPGLPGIYLPWDLEQVWTNLMISTSVGSFLLLASDLEIMSESSIIATYWSRLYELVSVLWGHSVKISYLDL